VLVLLAGAAFASACGDPPSAPSDGPQISCPAPPPPTPAADISGATVTYGPATAALGTPPLTGPTCNPASGSKFPIGTTTITCTVSDSRARTAACTFAVVVQSPSKLAVTRFVAFGDSITAGQIVGEGLIQQGSGSGARPRLVDPYLSYPADLTRDLTLRYPTQQPFVNNQGVSAEDTITGLQRLPSVLNPINEQPPQVLLLMDGANDIANNDPSKITPAVLNLDAMVRQAKSSNVRVIVGTLPPENPAACTGPNVPSGCVARGGGAALVVSLNAAVKVMAASEGVPVADVYQAFNGDVTTLIDFDGLHPTAAGYQVIADTFFGVIKQTLEMAAISTSAPFRAPSVSRPQRRR